MDGKVNISINMLFKIISPLVAPFLSSAELHYTGAESESNSFKFFSFFAKFNTSFFKNIQKFTIQLFSSYLQTIINRTLRIKCQNCWWWNEGIGRNRRWKWTENEKLKKKMKYWNKTTRESRFRRKSFIILEKGCLSRHFSIEKNNLFAMVKLVPEHIISIDHTFTIEKNIGGYRSSDSRFV